MRSNSRVLALVVLATLVISTGVVLTSCTERDPMTIRYAALPVLENLPVFVADDQGLFEEYGLQVELVAVQSAMERDALVRGGEADAGLIDPVGMALFNEDSLTVLGVRLINDPGSGKFALVVSPDQGVTEVSDLAGVPVGIAYNTITEYVADVMLRESGVPGEQIQLDEWRQINTRLEALVAGRLPSAILPEPFATYAVERGCEVVARDSDFGGLMVEVLCFTASMVEEYPDRVTDFLKALDGAIGLIEEDPERWGTLIQEKGLVPPIVEGQPTIPPFSPPSVPTEEQLTPILEWMVSKGMLGEVPPLDHMITADCLPTG